MRIGHVFPADANGPLSNDTCLENQSSMQGEIRLERARRVTSQHLHGGVVLCHAIESYCVATHHGDATQIRGSLGLYWTQELLQALSMD